MDLPELLCRHPGDDPVDHVAFVAEMVGFRVIMKELDVFSEQREILTRSDQCLDEQLHFVEASDIEFFKPHSLLAGVAHDQHGETISGHHVARKFSAGPILVIARLKIELSEFFT